MRIVSSISLLHRDPILRDLKILYRDEPITDLSKLQFAVINTGASPIAEEDVKAFPTVDFGPNRQILVSRILREDPADLRCTVAADAARRNATLRFRLLNPTDIVEFVVYTAGPAEASPAVSARIKGVKRLEIVDKTTEKIDPQPRPHWSVYPVGVFLFLCVLLLPASVREYRMHVTARRFLREASGDPFAEMTEPVHFREFMPSAPSRVMFSVMVE